MKIKSEVIESLPRTIGDHFVVVRSNHNVREGDIVKLTDINKTMICSGEQYCMVRVAGKPSLAVYLSQLDVSLAEALHIGRLYQLDINVIKCSINK